MTNVLPSQRCSAHSSRTGEQCKKLAIRGGTVCRSHGAGSPAVRAKAAARVALAEAAARGQRDPWTVLADALATADVLFVRARAEVDTHAATAETMAQLLDRLDLAARLSRQVIDSGQAERSVRIAEVQAAPIVAVFTRALDRMGLDPAARAAASRILHEELRRQGRLAIEGGAS